MERKSNGGDILRNLSVEVRTGAAHIYRDGTNYSIHASVTGEVLRIFAVLRGSILEPDQQEVKEVLNHAASARLGSRKSF